uniref:PrrA n=1 Tax=Treponema phagedenis TaxID=162 RepID=A0A191VM41_TREPH|nr:PrrA [Treponema phagedenis]
MKKLRFISFAILATALIVVSCQGPANPTKEPGNVQKAEEKKPEVKDPKAEEKKPEVKDPKAEEKKPEVKDPKAEEKKPEETSPGTEKPVAPGTEKPVAPGTEKPVAPGTEKPVAPGKEEPGKEEPGKEELHEFIGELCEIAEEEEMPADEVSRWVELAQKDFEQFGVKIVDKEADQPIKKGASEEDLKKRFVLEKDPNAELHGFIGELCEIAEEEEMPADEVSRWVELAQEDFEQFGVKIVDKEADQPIKKGASEEDLKKRFVLEKL